MMKQFGLLALTVVLAAGCKGPGGRPGGPGGEKGGLSGAELVKRLDKDGDGRISAVEFDGPDEHFTQFDTNKDGYLTEDEVPSGPPADGGGRR